MDAKPQTETRFGTQLWGKGYGDSHLWRRGGTPQVGAAPPEAKYTSYSCARCGARFNHYYDLEPVIFEAIERAGVKDSCEPAPAPAPAPW